MANEYYDAFWEYVDLGVSPKNAAANVLGIPAQATLAQLSDMERFQTEAGKYRAAKEIVNTDPTEGTVTVNQLREALAVVDHDSVNHPRHNTEYKLEDHDPVNHPRHYTQYKGLEIIDLTEQMNFNLGNAVKYIARAGFKDPEKELEDLEKAKWYLNREIERLNND